MEIRTLGSSDLPVTPIGLGLAALGRPGYINLDHGEDMQQGIEVEGMKRHTHHVLDTAWEAGIRYFDAARSYGKAERFLASWMAERGIGPNEVTVGSKWGYTYTADWQVDAKVHEVKEHSLEVFTRQYRESMGIIGSHLHLYQIHSATLSTGVLENDAVLDELARLKAGGLSIGLTLSGEGQADTLWKALDVERDGELLFQTVQATWNILERSAGEALAAAHEAGLGVLIKEAVANGRLTSKNDRPPFAEQRAVLEEVAEAHRTTIDALALAAVLARPWVDVVLSGAARAEHVLSNVRALEIEWDEATEERLAALVEEPAVYWSTRDDLEWN